LPASSINYCDDGTHKRDFNRFENGKLVHRTNYFAPTGSMQDFPQSEIHFNASSGKVDRQVTYDKAEPSSSWTSVAYQPDGKTPASSFRYIANGDSIATVFAADGKTRSEQTTYEWNSDISLRTKFAADGNTPIGFEMRNNASAQPPVPFDRQSKVP
jgi:hypothetical protein